MSHIVILHHRAERNSKARTHVPVRATAMRSLTGRLVARCSPIDSDLQKSYESRFLQLIRSVSTGSIVGLALGGCHPFALNPVFD
jgi:hypothetical protein